jgi:hypothetical protein
MLFSHKFIVLYQYITGNDNIFMLQCVEVSSPKTINITKYLNTNNFSVNNRHFVIKSSQTTHLYITKVFYKQFSCHHYIKNQN